MNRERRPTDHRKQSFFWAGNNLFDTYGPEIGPIALAVYFYLARCASYDEQTCYPTYKTIGLKCGISRSSTIKAIADLEDAGLLEITRRETEDGDATSNTYTLLNPPEHFARGRAPEKLPSICNKPPGPLKKPRGRPRKKSPLIFEENHHVKQDSVSEQDSVVNKTPSVPSEPSGTSSQPSVAEEGGAAAPAPPAAPDLAEVIAGAEQAGQKAKAAAKDQPDLPGMPRPPTRGTRSAPRPPTHPGNPRIEETMALWEGMIGYAPTSKGADRHAIKEMLSRGYTPERIVACARWLYSDPWWADKHRALPNVLKRIEEWHHQGEPAFHVERNGKSVRKETMQEELERVVAQYEAAERGGS